MSKFTTGPWFFCMSDSETCEFEVCTKGDVIAGEYGILSESNARLIAAAPDLLEALHEARRAIGDHYAPNDCYATGPVTGNSFRDLVQCPACSAIAMYDAAIAKARGG